MSFGLAARLSGAFDGVVDALHLTPGVTPDVVMAGEMMPMLTGDADDGERAAESARQFDRILRPLAGATYTADDVPTLEQLVSLGRCADVIVLGRPGSDPENVTPATVQTAIHDCARPVMIAPPEPGRGAFEHVMIAWNGSFQAARAVGYAMPFLVKAGRITVVVVGGKPERVGAPVLVRNLARAGIAATVESIDPGAVSARARGRALLRHVNEKGADLLVMGAYGRGQLMTFLGLGGATAKIISSCRVPLLVAH
jgi:nucleotide-binding universal stress UspA family protein